MSQRTKNSPPAKKESAAGGRGHVPRLRFPEFREAGEWEEKRLGNFIEEFREKSKVQNEFEIFTSARSGLVRQREYYDNNRITERDNIGFNIIPPNYLTYRSRSDDRRFYFNENDLGITGIISIYYPVFRVINGCNKFFIELLSQYSVIVGKYSIGTSQTVLSLNELRRIKLPVPKAPEQQRIADCLSSLDELITLEAQKLDELNAHKKGLMQQLFPAVGETLPKLRFPEFRDAGGWEERPLKSMCIMQAGKFVAAADIFEYGTEGMHPCYGGNGLRGYTKTYTHSGKYPLIGRQGALCGNVILVKGQFHATEHAVVATPKDGVDVTWLYYMLDFLDLNRFATGQAQPGLSVEVLDKVPSVVPQESEQQKIADCLFSLDELITAQIQKLDVLKAHKKGLMQQLFPVIGGESE